MNINRSTKELSSTDRRTESESRSIIRDEDVILLSTPNDCVSNHTITTHQILVMSYLRSLELKSSPRRHLGGSWSWFTRWRDNCEGLAELGLKDDREEGGMKGERGVDDNSGNVVDERRSRTLRRSQQGQLPQHGAYWDPYRRHSSFLL